MTAPGTFSSAQGTTGQHHLVLTGANGEPVVTSETHPTPGGSKQSLEVVVRTVLDAAAARGLLRDSGETGMDISVQEVTDHLWGQQ